MTLTIDETFDLETAALTDEERGRLLLCMQRYAAKGEEMALTGAEKYLWPVYRLRIDQARQVSAARAEAGRKGGEAGRKQPETADSEEKQTEANESKRKQTEANESKPKQTEAEKNLLPAPENEEKEKRTKKEKEGEREGTVPPLSVPHAGRETAAEALFARFWAAYPRKDDKKNAKRAFLRLKPSEETLGKMLAAIQKQKTSRQWMDAGGQYIPLPTTWLHGERWLDQAAAAPPGKAVSAQQYTQREYTEAELDAVSEDLFAQARALAP